MLNIVYFVELTWLLIDMLSGYFQNQGIFFLDNQTVSALVRIVVVGLFFAALFSNLKLNRFLTLLLIVFVCSLWISWHSLASAFEGRGNFVAEVQFILKLILPMLTFGVIQLQLKTGILTVVRIRRIVNFNASVLIFNLFLGVLGIGFGNYGESETGELIGTKGYFYAGNEVSATLIAIFALVMFTYRQVFKRNYLGLLTVVSIFFVASLLSLSKTSLIGFFLVLVFFMYNDLFFVRNAKYSIITSLTVIATAPWWYSLLEVSIERWEFLWETNSDFMEFISSGRSERVVNYLTWLNGNDIGWQLLFGTGQRGVAEVGSFENDLLDLTMSSGLLGVFFYAVWISWAWSGLVDRICRHIPEGAFVFYVMSMFIMLSVIAGHVIYSATLAPFIALVALASSQDSPFANSVADQV